MELGTWTWTAASGNFTGSTLSQSTIVELESGGDLDWAAGATGVLTDLALTPGQIESLHSGVGRDIDFWITLEEASPSTNIVLLGRDKFSIITTGPDV